MRRAFLLPIAENRCTLTPQQVALGYLLPGSIYVSKGCPAAGYLVMGIYLLSMVTALAAMGLEGVSLAVGLMLAIHASCILQVVISLYGSRNRRWRLKITALALVALMALVYYPAIRLINAWIAFPMRTFGGVVVIKPGGVDNVRTGEIVVRAIEGEMLTTIYQVAPGVDLGPVLGCAGEVITFSENTYTVGGRTHVRRGGMPKEGEHLIPEGHCFMWPQVNQIVPVVLWELSTVPEQQLIGRPYKRWFGRRQPLSP